MSSWKAWRGDSGAAEAAAAAAAAAAAIKYEKIRSGSGSVCGGCAASRREDPKTQMEDPDWQTSAQEAAEICPNDPGAFQAD